MKRLPTKAEFEALLKLPHKWDEERNGMVFTASNGNELFLPALGYRNRNAEYLRGKYGYYWSCTKNYMNSAYYFGFNSEDIVMRDECFDFYLTIRFVSDEPCAGFVDMGTGVYWATENYNEGEKIYFTWDEAMVIKDKVNGTAGLLMKKDGNTPKLNISDTLNWEQRRYEIAKDVYIYRIANSDLPDEWNAKRALETADELIKQLKQQDK